jgi:hypothetical protein
MVTPRRVKQPATRTLPTEVGTSAGRRFAVGGLLRALGATRDPFNRRVRSVAIYPRLRAIEPGDLATTIFERERPDRLSLRAAALCIGVLSLGAWMVILALLRLLG